MEYEILIRFLLAALWGGLVGAEREYRSKSAGFRTMIMISIGACFFTMMSMFIGGEGNPDRIASNIVTGIGFLGAGVIFRGEKRVDGITTAATIWAVAAVGMGIGAGRYVTAAIASTLILVVLVILRYFERTVDSWNQTHNYLVTCTYSASALHDLEQSLREHRLHYNLVGQTKDNDRLQLRWTVHGRAAAHRAFVEQTMKNPSIIRFEY